MHFKLYEASAQQPRRSVLHVLPGGFALAVSSSLQLQLQASDGAALHRSPPPGVGSPRSASAVCRCKVDQRFGTVRLEKQR